MTGFVYREGSAGFETGHYSPAGTFHRDGKFSNRDSAARRVAWLNGSGEIHMSMLTRLDALIALLSDEQRARFKG